MATVAITGGNGFVGRRLVKRHLDRGDTVRVLTRRGFNPLENTGSPVQYLGDLATSQIPSAFLKNADVLYHCAAELHDPSEMKRVNVEGTLHLLASASGRLGRWVQLSSAGIYGSNARGEVTEETRPAPRNPYEQSKAEADEEVIAAASRENFEYAILRPTNVFGPDMSNQSIRQWAMLIRMGLYFHVGPAGASANYVHVDNVVHALELCGAHPNAAGHIFNLSDFCTVEEFVGAMASALNVKTPTARVPLGLASLLARVAGWIPGNPLTRSRLGVLTDRSTYPIDLIERQLSYSHAISMEDGLRQTLRSFFPAR
jgi:nucleoside-diphosphate-sugar epimerase